MHLPKVPHEAIVKWLKEQPAATEIVAAGLSARVYSWKDSHTALKVARAPSSAAKLEQEARIYQESVTWSHGTLIHVPWSYGFFANRYKNLRIPDNVPFIAMQRLQPLSPEAELRLKQTYHPQHWEQKPQRLWRLYLGLDKEPELGSYFADDYPILTPEAVKILRLPVQTVARDMGLFVARLTFQGGWIDAATSFNVNSDTSSS